MKNKNGLQRSSSKIVLHHLFALNGHHTLEIGNRVYCKLLNYLENEVVVDRWK